jgi:immunoglobulin I-set domain protein
VKIRLLSIRTGLAGIVALLSIAAELIAQDPLDSWVRRTVPGPSAILTGVAYGNGTFVAVGNNSFVARSADGVTWTTSTAGAYGTLNRVRFLNGQFMAVGSSDKIIYSSDGASWTASPLPGAAFWDVAWGNGVYVLAGARAYVSSDGVNWTLTHPTLTSPFSGPYEPSLDTVVFGNGGFLALCGGGSPNPGIAQRRSLFSTNGIDWIAGGVGHTSSSGGNSELVYQDGIWASTTQRDFYAQDGVLVSTNNGGTWERRLGFLDGGGALSSGQGYFVVFQNIAIKLKQISSSTDSLSWQLRWPLTLSETNDGAALSAAFGNGTFVAVGYDGNGESYIFQSGNIGGLPMILHEPQDRSAIVDNPATFSVQAVGAPTLTYQWHRDGTAISNATNTSYTIAQVTTGDVAGYHVVITNSFGSVTSRVAQLTVSFLEIDLYAGLKILGVPGRTYRIDATPSSGPTSWQTLTNLVLPSSPYVWIDYESPDLPARIYRAGELP